MKTQFKDVAHLYQGVMMQTQMGVFPLITFYDGAWMLDTIAYGANAVEQDIFPILRPLSDISIEEAKQVLQAVFCPHVDYPLSDYRLKKNEYGHAIISIDNDWYSESLTLGTKTGSIWSSNDRSSSYIKVPGSVYAYLISQKFDIFGLLESGQAIDATTLTTPIKGLNKE